MNLEKHRYLIALSHFSKFGPTRLKKLFRYFNDYKSAFEASVNNLMKSGIEESVAREFVSFRGQIKIDEIIATLKKEDIDVISQSDENYPELLKEIHKPPQILYVKGTILKEEPSISVVGSRNYTNYGKQVIEDVVRDIARKGLTIISGLALGVDAHSHQVALEEGTRTLAVLGTGLDERSIYPSHNRFLASKIIKSGGAIISEFPIGTAPLKHHFPQRNRIISGLSKITLVIEAREKSGALITASTALEQNREVLAVPGSIYSPLSAGPNSLIKQGAKPVLSFEDVFELLDLEAISNYIKTEEIKPASKEEEIILKKLSKEPVHIDFLVKETGLDIRTLNTTLSLLEIKGVIKNLGAMNYILTK